MNEITEEIRETFLNKDVQYVSKVLGITPKQLEIVLIQLSEKGISGAEAGKRLKETLKELKNE